MRVFDTPRSAFVPRIRMINLIDILFILLIFFVATTTFRVAAEKEAERSPPPTAVNVSLPEASTGEAVPLGKEKDARVLISVTADGKLFVDDKPLPIENLEDILKKAKDDNPEVVLQFSADKDVSYGTVVAIVDAARAAGIRNLTAFTKKSVK